MNFSNFVGVDVSKLTIDVHLRGSNAFKTFANNTKGFTALLLWTKKLLPDVNQDSIMYALSIRACTALDLLFICRKRIFHSQ
jgi:transposase